VRDLQQQTIRTALFDAPHFSVGSCELSQGNQTLSGRGSQNFGSFRL